jgi:two-component system CheB/CheR fusion protein
VKRPSKQKPSRNKPRETSQPAARPSIAASEFPIAGIGASAGGLEAFEEFLKHVPPASGIAFVVVQHLDPKYKGLLPELLQRATKMEVFQVRDRMKVRPNCVYVIPPDKDMSILHGVLHLFKPREVRGLRLPIDFFFRSLADDRRENSIGIILSGMGSDGTLGLRAIKEHLGLALVQEPASAKFDSMPRSAIEAGLADIVAPAAELPGKILSYLQHAPVVTHAGPLPEGADQSALEKIAILLRTRSGHDFSLYKKSTVYRRVERRMGIHQIDKIETYVQYLQKNPNELDLLFKELLIGVTSFFRDPAVWAQLSKDIIPAILDSSASGQPLRAWIPGCSTGEEAYSLAIAFKEVVERTRPQGPAKLQIFATDLDGDAIDRARQGRFAPSIAADVSPERLRRFFTKEDSGYRLGKEIREMVIFAPQNVIMDPPFTRLDIISCRNLLIYLTTELQKKLIRLFHYSLKPAGILLLGSAETIGSGTNLFAPLPGKSRLYRKLEASARQEAVVIPASFAPATPDISKTAGTTPATGNLQFLADQVLLQRYSPPAVLVNNEGDILYVSGRTGKYLEPAAGKAHWNIFSMAREGLQYPLADAFKKALGQKEPVTLSNVKVGTNGGIQFVDVVVQLLDEPPALRGMVIIVFKDVAGVCEIAKPGVGVKVPIRSVRVRDLEQEVRQLREERQNAQHEMQASAEEAKSAQEEMQSTNEELQSTNEELTTSKEEMQSMNEELQTVNAELMGKVDALAQAHNDMKNLLDSTEIITVFLDNEQRIRRFTPGATTVFQLLPADVGRPLTDITTKLAYPALPEDVTEVLRTLVFRETQISSRDGRWFRVRIMPYRTLDNVINGVVITFADITQLKQASPSEGTESPS